MKQTLAFSIIIILSGYMCVNAQDLVITGKVTESNGSALPWTSVTLKGRDTSHTKSDKDGKYLLNLTSTGNDTLIFSHIGYDKQEIAIDNQQPIDVILTESIIDNSEVIAFAIGHQKKTETSANGIPNAYKQNDSVEIPNAYHPNEDKSIKMPIARLTEPFSEENKVIIRKFTPTPPSNREK